MAYIGYNPSQLAIAPFATKYFTGDGATTTFTLDQSVPGANEANVEVFVENVQQNPVDAYTIGGALNNQLIFSEAPVTGGAIYVIHKGEATYNLQPSTGSVTAATLDPVLRNFTVDNFTGNGSTTSFTLTDTPYSPNSILVTVDGIVQTASTNYTVSGTTLSFGTSAPDSGAIITVVHLGFSTGNKAVMDGSITPVKLSTGGPSWETNSRVSITGPTTGSLRISSSTANSTEKLGRVTGRAYDTSMTDFLAFDIRGLSSQNQIYYGGGSGLLNAVSEHRWIIAPNPNTIRGTDAMVLDVNGFLGLGADPAGTITTNYIAGNTNAKNLAINGNGAAASADGRLVLSNTQPYANIVVGSSTAGRVFFGFPNASGGTTTNFASIDSLAAGSGGANGYGITLRFKPKADNGADITAMQLLPTGTVDLPYGQIKFPAAQNASSDPNTLDDYEEGTYTCSLGSPNNCSGLVFGSCAYTKVGRIVVMSLTGSFTITSANTATTFTFTLPFDQMSNSERSEGMATYGNYRVGITTDNTSSNTTVGAICFPSTSIVETGSQSWSATYTYMSI